MLNDPLDRPGSRLDSLTNSVARRLRLTSKDLANPGVLRETIKDSLRWWEIIWFLSAARTYPLLTEVVRVAGKLNRWQTARLQVAYAVSIRTLVRWGPLYPHDVRRGDRYLGRIQISADDQSLQGALSDWVDVWLCPEGLRVNYLGGHLYLFSTSYRVKVSQCPSALKLAGQRAGYEETNPTAYYRELLIDLPTEGPVLLPAVTWARLKHQPIDVKLWHTFNALRYRPVTTPISEAEFDARRLMSAA